MLEVTKILTQKIYHRHIPCSFAYKLVCVDDEFTKPIVLFRGENAAYEFIKAILKEHQYCYELKNISIFNGKRVDFRYILR